MNNRRAIVILSPLLLCIIIVAGCIIAMDHESSATTETFSGITVEYTETDGGLIITKITQIPADGQLDLSKITNNGKGVTNLGTGSKIADAVKNSLKELVIPNSVTTIGAKAFYGCTELTTVSFSSEDNAGLITIGGEAFRGCSKLVMQIPSGVQTIGDKAFYQCTSLTTIKIPSGVQTVGTQTFYKCTSLTTITIPQTVKSIGQSAFNGCTGLLTTVTLEEGLETIGYTAFKGCTSLTTISIPSSVTSIDSTAFSGCTGLTTVTFSEGISAIGGLSGCTSLTTIRIPSSVTSIDSTAFSGCTGLTTVTFSEGISAIGGLSGCTSLTTIRIPSSVTSIDSTAFSGCTGLTKVTFDKGPGTIGEAAFSGCTSLSTISIPSTVKSIGKSAFNGCTKLNSVTLDEGLETIGESAFSGCTSLSKISIPSSVTSIGSSAFQDCSALNTITILNGSQLKDVGASAFKNCSSLISITSIPTSVTQYKQELFYGCSKLNSIGITDWNHATGFGSDWNTYEADGQKQVITCLTVDFSSLQDIKLDLLAAGIIPEGTKFNTITILNDTGQFEQDCFKGVSAKKLIINKITQASTKVFYDIDVKDVTISGDVTKIPAYYFTKQYQNTISASNGYITKLEITTTGNLDIGDLAFAGCVSLTSVNFGKVNNIGDRAFMGCKGLAAEDEYVDLTGVNGTIRTSAFDNTSYGLNVTSESKFTDPSGVKVDYSRLYINGKLYGTTELKVNDQCSIFYMNNDKYEGNEIMKVQVTGDVTELKLLDEWNITSIYNKTGEATVFGNLPFKTIDLGSKIKHIGTNAFYGSKTIESVTWSSDQVDLGNYAFYRCASLKTIGNSENSIVSVKSIGTNVFGDCTSLVYIAYSDDLVLGTQTFKGCSSLVFNTEGVVRVTADIGTEAFSGTAVKKAIISVEKLEGSSYQFQNCLSLKEVVIEKEGFPLPLGIFKDCNNLDSLTYGTAEDGVNVIKSDSIGDYALNNTGLKNITISSPTNGIVKIGDHAFDSCSELTEVTFSAYVDIDQVAFTTCENLKTVTFMQESSDSLGSKIGNGAFENCVLLTSSKGKERLELNGVTSIGPRAFNGCISIKEVYVSKALETVQVDSFIGCTSLMTSDGQSNGIAIESGGKMAVDGDMIITDATDGGKKIVMINPNVESIFIKKNISEIEGIKEVTATNLTVDSAISILPNLKRISVQDGNAKYKSVSGMLVTIEGVLVAVPCSMPTDGYLEISGIDTIGQSALRDVNVKELVIYGASDVQRIAFYQCDMLQRLTVDSGSGSLTFNIESLPRHIMESILIKGGDVKITNTDHLMVRSLTIVCKNVTFSQMAVNLESKEAYFMTSLTISADDTINWSENLVDNSKGLKQLTLASKEIKLHTDKIVNANNVKPVLNLSIDGLSFKEGLVDSSIDCYVSETMSTSWNGNYKGLIYYDADYGVLKAVKDTKVYVLSDFAKIESINSEGKFTVNSEDRFSPGDLIVQIKGSDGEMTLLTASDEMEYSIGSYSSSTVYLIIIDEKEDGSDGTKWHKVTFDANTGEDGTKIDISPIYIYDGHSILTSALPTPERPGFKFLGWYTSSDDTAAMYKANDAGHITVDCTLYAKWESLGDYLDLDSSAGIFYVLKDDGTIGEKYDGGTFTNGTVKLRFVPYTGYTLIGMGLTNLNEDVMQDDLTLSISSVSGYACITPIVKYFSSSTDLEYVVERDTPKPTDNIVLAWRFSGEVNQSGMAWSGMPSVPLIVDDRVYIQVNDRIVCLDANTGATISYIQTGVSTTQFYHYLGYGGGAGGEEYIVDYTSMKVYTYDLEEVCGIPKGIQYTVWHDGFFYGIVKDDESSKGTVWKMSPTQLDDSKVMKNLWEATQTDVNAFQYMYGTTSHAIVEGDVMYYISVNGRDITINALNLSNGAYGSRQLDKLYGYYLDDGWLTYYNGYLYITAYTKGLFGTYDVIGNSVIGYMKVDGTTINDPEYVIIKDKNGKEENRDSLTSAFVIQNGRGYLNITKASQSQVGYFQVFDIGEDGEPVFVEEVDSVASHGSIVASTYNLTKGADGKLNGEVYIYIMNYSAGQVICIFTDVCKDGEWTLSDKGVKFSIESGFGSQAVRVGTEGQLIFYNDSGFVYCYGTPEFAKKSWFFVDNGDTAEITTGDGVDGDSIKAFEKAVANMLGVRKATFDKTSGTVYALGATYYVYYYGNDGQAYSVKFTDTFNLNKFSKIKTFYLNKDVSSADNLDPDAKWDYVETKDEHVTVSVKDIVQDLRSYEPMTIEKLKPYVSYGYGDEYYTYYGQSGDVVELKLEKLPTKDGYTFVGFTDGQTIYKYSVNGDKITAPGYVLKGYVVLEAVWYEDNKTFNNVEVKIGDDLIVEDKDVTTLLVGFDGKVTVTLDGSGVYTISSSNNNILKIENGELVALKAGKAVMTVTVSSPIKDQTITVEVNVVEPTSSTVTLNKSSIGLYKGGSETLSASTDLDGVGVIWTSSDPKIAIVDSNGKVTAISEGIVLITATAMDNSDAKSVCTVTVSLKKVTAISLSQISKTMKVGDSSALTATIAPTDAEDKRVTWASSNPSVVSVTTSGAIQALSKGTAIITATSVDGSYSASCTIKVEGTVSEITLDKTMIRLEVGSNSALKATTYPDEALSDNIGWKSSDSSIASVSGGYVYAYKAGTATITVSYGDLTAVCTVVVSEKSVVKEDTKENTDGSKTVTKEEKTVSGDSTITTNTQETKDKNDKSMGSDVKISAESENKAVKTEATVKKDADGRVIESEVKTTVEAKIQTKDGKEIVSVSKEDILSAVDQIGAVKNTAGGSVEPVIVIDIGKASTAVSSSIDLSYESLIQIADGNDTTLRVNTSAGTLEMSSDVISTLSSDGSDLKLGIEKVSDEDVTKAMKEKVKDSTVFSLSATLGKTSIHQLGGKVSVTLPYALKGTVSSDVRIYHVDDDGTLKEMSCKYDAIGGTVSFVTDHFSYFVVSEESLIADEPTDTGGDNELNTLLKIVIGLLAALIAVAIVSMILRIRGN